MCSASEAPSLPGSGILMRPTLMRPNQDQIQAPAQPRQRRAEPEKGFRAAFFHFSQGYTGNVTKKCSKNLARLTARIFFKQTWSIVDLWMRNDVPLRSVGFGRVSLYSLKSRAPQKNWISAQRRDVAPLVGLLSVEAKYQVPPHTESLAVRANRHPFGRRKIV